MIANYPAVLVYDSDNWWNTVNLSCRLSPDEENLQDLYDKMEQVVIAILNDDNFDDLGTAGKTAAVICEICYPFFDRKLFPEDPDEE